MRFNIFAKSFSDLVTMELWTMNEDSNLSFVDASLKNMQWSYIGLSPELYQANQEQNQANETYIHFWI